MSPIAETDAAVARIAARHVPVGVLQCTTAYPCPPEKVGLNLIAYYRERFDDMRRSLEVGLAELQVHDVDPLPLERLRPIADLDGEERLDLAHPWRQAHYRHIRRRARATWR